MPLSIIGQIGVPLSGQLKILRLQYAVRRISFLR